MAIALLCVFFSIASISALAIWPLSLTVNFNSEAGMVSFTGSYLVNSARSIRLKDAHGNLVFEDTETHNFPFSVIVPKGSQVRNAELEIQYDRFVPCIQKTEIFISQ